MSKRNYKKNKKIFRVRLPSNMRFIATIFIVASILTVIFFVIVRYSNDAGVSGVNSSSVAVKNEDAEQERIAIAKKVDALVMDSGPESAQEYLNSEIKSATDAEEEAQLYIDKAVLAGSLPGGQNYAQAIEFALKADGLYPTEESALIVANIEMNQNNIPNAIKYYKIYLDRASKGLEGEALDDSTYDYYYRLISDLEAGIK